MASSSVNNRQITNRIDSIAYCVLALPFTLHPKNPLRQVPGNRVRGERRFYLGPAHPLEFDIVIAMHQVRPLCQSGNMTEKYFRRDRPINIVRSASIARHRVMRRLRRMLPGRHPSAVLSRLRRHGGRGVGSTKGSAPTWWPNSTPITRPVKTAAAPFTVRPASGLTPKHCDAVITSTAPSRARCSKSVKKIAATRRRAGVESSRQSASRPVGSRMKCAKS